MLVVLVLGSIFLGIATPTEAAGVGAVGATLLTVANKKFSLTILREVMHSTLQLTCMVFIILVGAASFGLVFRGMGGDELVRAIVPHLRSGDRVLDVGCGFGAVGRAILDDPACPEGVELRVHPTLIPDDLLLADVDGVKNAILVEGNAVGPTLYYGAGAGAAGDGRTGG